MSADKIFPIMVIRSTRLRPCLSDRAPIFGETMNCSVLSFLLKRRAHSSSSGTTHENTEPISPPAIFDFKLWLSANLTKVVTVPTHLEEPHPISGNARLIYTRSFAQATRISKSSTRNLMDPMLLSAPKTRRVMIKECFSRSQAHQCVPFHEPGKKRERNSEREKIKDKRQENYCFNFGHG